MRENIPTAYHIPNGDDTRWLVMLRCYYWDFRRCGGGTNEILCNPLGFFSGVPFMSLLRFVVVIEERIPKNGGGGENKKCRRPKKIKQKKISVHCSSSSCRFSGGGGQPIYVYIYIIKMQVKKRKRRFFVFFFLLFKLYIYIWLYTDNTLYSVLRVWYFMA